ncbi:SCO6880 family protein [Microbacterium azadirachtae]|uniref:SCO6880 family protein n=1 Tax=Microbacterium azadirachtae TaxID=582680 RepID=UPI0008871AA3|nr:SCO6880 family protein [Microbacterium azadirachtae]SDL93958.1 Putative type VII ESX secretion system translocon, EccE [Microbacterium azadirachtae]SEG14040.1 Putative type VII ESX secretion system translocon, EccE [Microbacterium azadirachtae]SEG16547.1 Putative type VII ESX secretion system translocon, EccE [Microbacterium azadirachtae]
MTTITADQLLTDEGAPRVRFAARERRGIFLGLTFLQLVVIGAAVAILLATLFINPNAFWVMLPLIALVVFLALATYRREPVLVIAAQAARYGYRSITGQTAFRRDVWLRVTMASLSVGQAQAAAVTPVVTSKFLLPGALGDVQVIQIPGAGGFIYNARGRLAAVTVKVGSRAWALRDKGTQEAAYDGFVEWLSSLENLPGVRETTIRLRVDRASSTQLKDYLVAREDEFGPQVSAELREQYWALTQAASKRSMGFTNYITLTFDTAALNGAIRDAGKGLTGLAAVLKERVAGIETSMEHARLTPAGWLTADELDELNALSADPVAAATRREQDSDIVSAPSPVMGIDEGWDSMRVDESWHQTFWVAEWPRTDVRTGFLEPLLYAGDATRVITLQVRPVATHKALAQLNRAQSDMETAATIRMKLSSRIPLTHLREEEDLAVREHDLVDGFGDVQYRGFVTISAESKDALTKARTDIEQASHPARLVLASMSGQQAAGFVTAALPVPLEGE